ncbi:MAG: hypothetical protein WBZ51_22290, partial [Xanthobacteraceae bacterium]
MQEILECWLPRARIAGESWVAVILVRRETHELAISTVPDKGIEPGSRDRGAPVFIILTVKPKRGNFCGRTVPCEQGGHPFDAAWLLGIGLRAASAATGKIDSSSDTRNALG